METRRVGKPRSFAGRIENKNFAAAMRIVIETRPTPLHVHLAYPSFAPSNSALPQSIQDLQAIRPYRTSIREPPSATGNCYYHRLSNCCLSPAPFARAVPGCEASNHVGLCPVPLCRIIGIRQWRGGGFVV